MARPSGECNGQPCWTEADLQEIDSERAALVAANANLSAENTDLQAQINANNQTINDNNQTIGALDAEENWGEQNQCPQ